MQEDKEPYNREDQEDTPPEIEKSSVPEDTPDSEFEDQENTPPEAEELSVTQDTPDPEFEEQQGEVLPPEKKKGRGFGFFLFIILILIGGVGYLYYAKQIPPIIREPLELLSKPLKNQLAKLRSESISRNSKKPVSKVEKKIQAPSVQEKTLKEVTVFEKEIKNFPSPTEQHVSGFQVESKSEVDEGIANYTAQISGNTIQIEQKPKTLIKHFGVENQVSETEKEAHGTYVQVHEAEIEESKVETEKEEAPMVSPVMASSPLLSPKLIENPIEKTKIEEKPTERSKAVQAYLDFVESTVVKTGELIKKGFIKGKFFLLKFVS